MLVTLWHGMTLSIVPAFELGYTSVLNFFRGIGEGGSVVGGLFEVLTASSVGRSSIIDGLSGVEPIFMLQEKLYRLASFGCNYYILRLSL